MDLPTPSARTPGITALTNGFRDGSDSPVAALARTMAQANASQPVLNAFTAFDPSAEEAAQQSADRWARGAEIGPLDGMPISIKDNIHAMGMPSRYGSRSTPDAPDTFDSPSVARLREAGAVIFGKTTLPEFAHKITTDSPLTGITRNPWDLTRTPGGSSGGASAAMAGGIGAAAIGTDGGGSIRVPCAWTGLFGLKPSFGRVPHHPRGPFAMLSHVGPMTRCVADARLLMEALARPDVADWFALPEGAEGRRMPERGVTGLRIALSPQLGLPDQVEPDIAATVRHVADLLSDGGAQLTEANPPLVAEATQLHGVLWSSFCYRVLSKMSAEARDAVDPTLTELADLGATITRDHVVEAIIARGEIGHAANRFFSDHDILIAPVTATVAPEIDGPGRPRPGFTQWSNHTGFPAASIPAGLTSAGLPIGVQIIGPRFSDALVLDVCDWLEARLPVMPEAPHVF
ncbi:amidase family protein [Pseudooceanicola sp. C21-150M6]|uniref:amidase family protein n=1 Tax=Pseudooceanicola sp. C21-150M6 TaxID=3434355 RepID=UPI003D7FB447